MVAPTKKKPRNSGAKRDCVEQKREETRPDNQPSRIDCPQSSANPMPDTWQGAKERFALSTLAHRTVKCFAPTLSPWLLFEPRLQR